MEDRMANEFNPNDPYDRDRLKDPIKTNIGERRSPLVLDNDLQADPELAEGRASSSRVAMFAVGIAIVLGLVFYSLNSTPVQNAATTPPPATTQKSAETSPPAAPPGMRDVTPRTNSQPGTTTGTAPLQNPPSAPANNANAPANNSK
jgi:hypothetical protein